jgi:hypothetical protein
MALVLQPLDQVLRIQADSAIGPTMHSQVPLPVSLDTGFGDEGLQYWTFGHTSV